MKYIFSFIFIFLMNSPVKADLSIDTNEYSASGNIYVFDELPGVAWLLGDILVDDYFHLRRIIRQHDIHTIILDSPGGDLYEGLYISAVLHDREINTYVPAEAFCESSCANIFFAGNSRIARGALGVHQFSWNQPTEDETNTQLAVSDIISFLNEFSTPVIVYEKMFESPEMYYFSQREVGEINRIGKVEISSLEMDKYDAVFEQILYSFYDQSDSDGNREVDEEGVDQIAGPFTNPLTANDVLEKINSIKLSEFVFSCEMAGSDTVIFGVGDTVFDGDVTKFSFTSSEGFDYAGELISGAVSDSAIMIEILGNTAYFSGILERDPDRGVLLFNIDHELSSGCAFEISIQSQ